MMHYVHKSLTAPDTPIPVGLAGCGGTGSQILSGLARLNRALVSLNHPGLDVTVYDPDRVSEANIGRQLFSPADIGRYKAEVLVTRVNQFMGFSWKAAPVRYGVDSGKGERYDLLITAVDTAQTRLKIAGKVRRQPCYWLDTGNTRRTGQVILGSSISFPQPDSASNAIGRLPMVTELYNLKRVKEDAHGPSCSLEAALEQQDLMINQMVATCALHLLWQCFRQGVIAIHGGFVDLVNMRVNPLPIDPKVWERLSDKAWVVPKKPAKRN